MTQNYNEEKIDCLRVESLLIIILFILFQIKYECHIPKRQNIEINLNKFLIL